MPHSHPSSVQPAFMVGRTPWSAADAPVGLLAPCKMLLSLFRLRDGEARRKKPEAHRADSPMPHSFPTNVQPAFMVGRTPWSAADAPVGLRLRDGEAPRKPEARSADSPMPHSFPTNVQSAFMVGRTPRSAADAPVGLHGPCKMLLSLFRLRDAPVGRGLGGPPHLFPRICSSGKNHVALR